MSLGHAAIYGLGAYASALLGVHLGLSPWLTIPLGGLFASLLGLILVFPTLRLVSIYLAVHQVSF